MKRYFHCTNKRLPVGTILNGANTNSGLRRPKCSGHVGGPALFLTGKVQPHYTILAEAKEGRWFIYEVEPIGKVDIADDWDEYIVRAARVIRFVRRAKVDDYSSAVYKRAYVQDQNDYSNEETFFGKKTKAKSFRT